MMRPMLPHPVGGSSSSPTPTRCLLITIAGLVLPMLLFCHVFVPSATSQQTLTARRLPARSFTYTPPWPRGHVRRVPRSILPETLASAICVTDGSAVVACWGEDSDRYPAGTPVVLGSTLRVLQSKHGVSLRARPPRPASPGSFFRACTPASRRRSSCATAA